MHQKGPLTFAFFSAVADWLAVALALGGAYWIRFGSGWIAAPRGVPDFGSYLPGFLFTAFGWVVIFAFLGLYAPNRGLNWSDETLLVLKGAMLGTFLAMSTAFLYRGISYSRLFFVLAVPLAFLFVLAARGAGRKVRLALRARGFGVECALFVGGGRLVDEIRRRIEARPDLGFRIVGALSDEDLPVPEGVRDLGRPEAIAEVCRREEVSRVFIALPEEKRETIVGILRACENLPLRFEIVPDLFGRLGERMRVSEMDGIPLLGVKGFPLEAWNRFVKRTFDIVLASLLILLLLPFLPVVAAAIKIDSPGPVFYRQRRIGRDGRVFDIAKLRSMVLDAEAETGPVWAKKGDERRTRIGSLIRRTSLDELPQLWNVLRGEMSLIGPRPERPHFVRRFERDVPRYFDRHRVKSGMTGWAQVNGLRGNTPIEERTLYDVFYVENWSLLFDVKILFLTARHLVRHALRPEGDDPEPSTR
ncbi:MAG: undecaprenyl-phosphate glucose phosphotransferase [Candidatus Eisenbacteria bacterium]